jgi:hypothetical protein
MRPAIGTCVALSNDFIVSTITQPTIGFGAVVPNPFLAISMQRFIYLECKAMSSFITLLYICIFDATKIRFIITLLY